MRVLFLTHRLPYAANRGDRIRALHVLKHLRRTAEVDLLSFVHDEEEESHGADLRNLASTVTIVRLHRLRGWGRALAALATDRPLTHAILDSPHLGATTRRIVDEHPPDVVLAYCSGMARLALEPPLDAIPFVLDMVDVDSEKWKRLGTTSAPPARWVYAREARVLAAFEARAARAARAVLVVNDRERASLLDIEPDACVHVLPNGIAVAEFSRPAASDQARVVFCGVMNYQPNEEGVLWFARNVWPTIRERRPDARLSLVGSGPSAAVRRLSADPTIEVTGEVPDVRPYLWRSAVAVAPLFLSRGVQNKVLEAVAAGLPCVVTPEVGEGLPPEVLPACVPVGGAAGFAEATLRLLAVSAADRRAVASRASLDSTGWPAQLSPLAGILESAVEESSRRG